MQPAISHLEVLGLVPFGNSGPQKQFFALRLQRPGWSNWYPGQFLMLRPDSFGTGLPWGRPFGICHMTARHLICFFRVRGEGTRRMAQLHNGDHVTVWGPLGSHFVMEPDRPTLLLAGGMGIVPFVGYVNRHPQPWNLSMLFGHKEPLGCFPVDSINEHIQVDSLREHGSGDLDNFIYSLQERIRDNAEQNGLALACGPTPFLRTVKRIASECGARLQVSLENRMACGIGACLGCVCQSTVQQSYETENMPVQTCTHGPVFWANEVEF